MEVRIVCDRVIQCLFSSPALFQVAVQGISLELTQLLAVRGVVQLHEAVLAEVTGAPGGHFVCHRHPGGSKEGAHLTHAALLLVAVDEFRIAAADQAVCSME